MQSFVWNYEKGKTFSVYQIAYGTLYGYRNRAVWCKADTTSYNLRHSHASMLVDMGVAPLEIAERLGHEKVETTLNTYSHLYPSTQSKLAGLLDKKHEEEEE